MAQNWDYHEGYEHVGNLSLQYQESANTTRYIDITIFEDCVHTVAYLNTLAAQS